MAEMWEKMPGEMRMEIEKIKSTLRLTDKDQVIQSPDNCERALSQDPFIGKALRHNVWSDTVEIIGDVGWNRSGSEMDDTDISHIWLYMDRFYDQRNKQHVVAAINVVANGNPYDPVRSRLECLVWDGQERIRYALHHFLGADADDMTYECFRVFLMGAIERIYHPGAKVENMLCLVGDQGAGKSSFFRFLAMEDDWFTDDLKYINDENVYRKLQGHWIIEMAEMLGTANAKSVEEIKSFLSRQEDIYKVPYETKAKSRPRKCVFVGTTNKQRFLPLDRTGNRRFLPILTDASQAEAHVLEDTEATKEYMRQIWAEAMSMYQSGNKSLRLPPGMEKQMEQRRREFMAEDTTAGLIQLWLDEYKGDHVCTQMLYAEALHQFGKPDRASINEINDIMDHSVDGWERASQHRFPKYGPQRAWKRVNKPTLCMDEATQMEIPAEWLKSGPAGSSGEEK